MKANWPIGITVGFSALHYAVTGYAGYDPSMEAEYIIAFAFSIVLAWWTLDDAKQRGYHRPYEFGAFLFFVWPLVLPAYLIATRGWRGIGLFTLFLTLYLIPWLSGWAAYYLSP